MITQPRIIKSSNLQPGVWHKNTEIVPPDNRRVLCCDLTGKMWFDTFDQHWSSPIAPDLFVWQWVSKPLDMIFD